MKKNKVLKIVKVLDHIEKRVQGICAFMVLGILVATLMQVVWRYVLNSPLMWTEELARFLGIWMVLLFAGVVVREEGHLGFDILPDSMKPALSLISNLAIILFAVLLFKGAMDYVLIEPEIKSSALQIPRWFMYSSIPAGLVLMVIFALDGIIKNSVIPYLIHKKKGKV